MGTRHAPTPTGWHIDPAFDHYRFRFAVRSQDAERVTSTIPSDNPLVGVASVSACGTGVGCGPSNTDPTTLALAAPRTDIWAWGFRNPWRSWVDPLTGLLWVGDVGEVTYEEITIVSKGRHHGRPYREGAVGYPTSKCSSITPAGDCIDPVYTCTHAAGSPTLDAGCNSITGGVIVDSCDWPATFKGLYFFGDNGNDSLWTLQPNLGRDGVVAGSRNDFGSVTGAPVSMRTGPDGALYVASFGGARLVRFAPTTPVPCGADAGDGGVETGVADASVADTSVADTSVADTSGSGGGSTDGSSGGEGGGEIVGAKDADTADDAGAPVGDRGGCGCIVAGSGESKGFGRSAVILIGLAVARRRRSKRG